MKRWLAAIPVALLLGFGAIALMQLLNPEKGDFERQLREAPTRSFQSIDGDSALTFNPPPGGKPIAVNLFASWCAPCAVEHPLLMQLGEDFPDQVYGVLYKDTVPNGKGFLAERGDPYTHIVLDPDGQGGLDFGLTGVPETFVISPDGEILLHIGGMVEDGDIAQISVLLDASAAQ